MCTLTYIPHSGGTIITSNRDEHISRGNSIFPISKSLNNKHIYFPQDPKAGGSWIAADDFGNIVVLLNGAFKKHKHLPPYRLSRGIILLDSFNYSNLKEFTEQYTLEQIEPFTMVQFQLRLQHVCEMRWDGESTHYKDLDPSIPNIWSSTSLYSTEVRLERRHWFSEWIQNGGLDSQKMLEFHQFGGKGNTKNGITMQRDNGVQTVSITQLHAYSQEIDFVHHNLIQKEINTQRIHMQ
jgi:hypothetical protein